MKQKDADLQQDYLDAMDLIGRHMAGSSTPSAAESLSKFAADLSQQAGPEFAELNVIALLNLCRAQARLQQTDESLRTRLKAISVFDQIRESGSQLNIQDRLADALIEFEEYRRAIRPCERAIKLSGGGAKLANRLWRAGRTYLRAGFKPQAEEPLRRALEYFRTQKDGPYTPVVLIDLGNALRQALPSEAERSYREAAGIWEKRGANGQASIAWVNLGILCGEQGRLNESLQWYEKARQVRQADPSTPRARRGSLANNIANLHRRLKNFEQAEKETEDAIALLEDDPVLADAYGTRGLILRDQGFDEASLEWFQRSRAEHARQPSPNMSQLSEVLANEAEVLARLGRSREADILKQELSKLHSDLPPLPEHKVTPAPKMIIDAGKAAGEVLVELDGIHLPEWVYESCDIATLENRLEAVLEMEEQGELDGHETGPENTTLFLYGADANELFRAIEPVLRKYPLCQGARVTIRQDSEERHVVIP
jgi:tetratricopeptide (TPR) repeat protein